jgi:hypothetical protein
MSLLTNITQAQINANKTELDGKVLTRPALLVTDGTALIYAVDVDIGAKGEMLKNVPLARANHDLLYAEPGNACRLRRTADGKFEVVGFSKELPGRYDRFTVDLGTYAIGPTVAFGLDARPFTLGELATLPGGFGVAPLGATGIWQGGILIEVKF